MLRSQRLSYKPDPRAPVLRQFFVFVTQRAGPFMIRREFLAPDA
jgi:hypothetical protein